MNTSTFSEALSRAIETSDTSLHVSSDRKFKKGYVKPHTTTPSILNGYYNTFSRNVSDGINVCRDTDGIGGELDMSSIHPFVHPFGTFPSIEVFMCYLNTPEMPRTYLGGETFNLAKRLRESGLKRVELSNYWSIIFEGMFYQLRQNKTLLTGLLATGTKSFTSFRKKDIDKEKVTLHRNMIRYCSCLNLLRKIFVEIENNPDDVNLANNLLTKGMRDCKDKPDLDVYADVYFL